MTIVRSTLVCVCAGFFLAACSSTAPSAQQPAPPSVLQVTANVEYADSDVRQRMEQVALIEPFGKYWSAHVSRDWARMYSYESADLPLSLDFYVPYHARAWQIEKLEVLKVEIESETAALRLAVHAKNPKTLKLTVSYLDDNWKQVDGVWRHRVTDPFLTVDPKTGPSGS